MDTPNRGNGHTRLAESTTQEADGASQIGPFGPGDPSRPAGTATVGELRA